MFFESKERRGSEVKGGYLADRRVALGFFQHERDLRLAKLRSLHRSLHHLTHDPKLELSSSKRSRKRAAGHSGFTANDQETGSESCRVTERYWCGSRRHINVVRANLGSPV